jgi:hypothetical protein
LCRAGPCGKHLPSKLDDRFMLGFSACMESPLSNVQVESEQSSLHTKHNLKKTHPPSLPHPHEKRDALHSMTRFLISCMEILFLKFAATIFGLGRFPLQRTPYLFKDECCVHFNISKSHSSAQSSVLIMNC